MLHYFREGAHKKCVYYIYILNFSKMKDFYPYKNVPSHVKINVTCEYINDVICVAKFGPFNCWTNLNLFLFDRNIFEDCSEIFSNLRQSSNILGHFRKMTRNVRMGIVQSLENAPKSSRNY